MDSYLFTSSFDVNHEYHLVPEEAAYALTIEVPIPLEYLIVSASVHVDIIPDPECNNIVSETPITNQSQNYSPPYASRRMMAHVIEQR